MTKQTSLFATKRTRGLIAVVLIAVTGSGLGGAAADDKSRSKLKVVRKPPKTIALNGGFESGKEHEADNWDTAAGVPPGRSDAAAHTGAFSMHSLLLNEGPKPKEGLLSQAVAQVAGGETYELSFWVKQVSSGVSYMQQYQIQWFNKTGGTVSDTALADFKGVKEVWKKVSVTDLVAPKTAVSAKIRFRFVTGAVDGGVGEVFLDDVVLGPARATIAPIDSEPKKDRVAPEPDPVKPAASDVHPDDKKKPAVHGKLAPPPKQADVSGE